jgi:hypothetical protein
MACVEITPNKAKGWWSKLCDIVEGSVVQGLAVNVTMDLKDGG